jgi:glucose/mannose-6-phosphate isomerase
VTDTLGFLEAVCTLPEQLAAAHEAAAAVPARQLPDADRHTSVVVFGMGGSGIAGDALAAVSAGSLRLPLTVVKGPEIPASVGDGTLAFALSYSGDTEETLLAAEAALAAGARIVAVTCGGALGKLAREGDGLVVDCPEGLMPRAAIGALVAPLLVVLYRMGLFPEAHALLVTAQEQLARRRDQCRQEVTGPANPARELARQIGRTVPLVYGAGAIGGVAAYRWKCDVNENAKAPAFWNVYPELDHNEICQWGQHGDLTRQAMTLVELRHGFEHPRVTARVGVTRRLVEEAVFQVLTVEAAGEGCLAQLLDLMYVGDWVSCYLALDNDVDPGPIDTIRQLKAELGT